MAFCNTQNSLYFSRIEDDRELSALIRRCAEIDYGEYNDRGGGTTIAHLRWNLDLANENFVACRFEGETGLHTITLGKPVPALTNDPLSDSDVERIVSHWKGYTETIQKRYEKRLAKMFPHRRNNVVAFAPKPGK